MKMTRRIAALLLVIMMLLAAMPVIAEDAGDTTKITITNNNSNITIVGSEFKAYKLFNAIYNAETEAIVFNYDANSCVAVTYNGKSGNDLIAVVGEMTDESDIRAFADAVYANAGGTATATKTANAETVVIDGLEPGYYLITVKVSNVNGADDQDGVVSRAILVSAYGSEGVTATLKADAPSMTKQIQHNELADDDANGVDMVNGWGPVGDNQIGDTVHYRTITTVPDVEGYETYVYVIHDTMDAGLTFVEDSVAIYVGNNKNAKLDPNSDFAVGLTDEDHPDHTFCVQVDIMLLVDSGVISAGDELYTYYDAILNEDALIYDEGHNDNVAYLEYSNDVYDTTGEKTDNTPEVKVYDWTFKYGIAKVDTDGNALTGAKFVLSEDDSLTITYNEATGELSSTDGLIGFVSASDYTITKTPANYIIDAGEAALKGLDDKTTYYLYEVLEPVGYSKLDAPVAFTITSSYNTVGNELAENMPSATATGDVAEADVNGCELGVGIVNVSGSVLPATGGQGTQNYYIIGGAVVLLAGVALLLLRRRASK